MNNLNNPLFLILIFSGITFVLGGWLVLRFPPKKINRWYGYRTQSSMRSQARWDFAQAYSARQMIHLGLALMACSLLSMFIETSAATGTALGIGIMLLGLMVMFVRIENAIKAHFQ